MKNDKPGVTARVAKSDTVIRFPVRMRSTAIIRKSIALRQQSTALIEKLQKRTLVMEVVDRKPERLDTLVGVACARDETLKFIDLILAAEAQTKRVFTKAAACIVADAEQALAAVEGA